jgi:tRNA pseudouridine38-40 synthase
MPIRTLKLTLAYDGTNYVGWQRQVNGLSVQEVVESSFVPLMVTARERKNVAGDQAPAARRGPTVSGAGRTDAGVHALGQVASVNVDLDLAPSAMQRPTWSAPTTSRRFRPRVLPFVTRSAPFAGSSS